MKEGHRAAFAHRIRSTIAQGRALWPVESSRYEDVWRSCGGGVVDSLMTKSAYVYTQIG